MAWSDGGPLIIPESAPRTLTEALLRAARDYPDQGILLLQTDGSEIFLSYPELLQQARSILTGLRARGLKAGDRAILQLDRLADHFPSFWACVLGGIVPVTVAIAPSYQEKNGVVSKLFNIWELLDHPPILTNTHLSAALLGLPKIVPMESLRVWPVEDLRQNQPAEDLYPTRPDEVIFYQLTSGSTGIPKCIQETHQGIIAHIHGAAQFNGYTSENISFNWLPMDHVVPILTVHLKDLYLGSRQIHAKSDLVLSDPLRWLDLMEKHRVTHTWSPNFGFKLLSEEMARHSERSWDLSRLERLMNAGEQVTVPVVREFLEQAGRFGLRPEAMQPAFGMAEACTCMTYANDFSLKTGARRFEKSSLGGVLKPSEAQDGSAIEFVDLGPPVPGVEIRITNSQNQLVAERVIGRFQIRGRVITPGYLKNEAANRDAFVGEGWFNSGDIGFMADGRLFLTGREKEMIIVRGANFYCYEIEDVVNRVPGVEPTCAAACGIADPKSGTEGLAIFFVPQDGRQRGQIARTIRTRVAADLGIAPGWVVPLERADFPKTTSGKIQRTQMKKALESGAYDTLLAGLEQEQNKGREEVASEPEKALAAIWAEVLGIPGPGRRDNFFELGGDSLKAIQVLSRVRERLQAELPLRSLFEESATIAGMAGAIAGGGTVNADPAIVPVSTSRPRRLSFPQQRLWLVEQVESGTALYHVCRALRIEGPLRIDLLRESLNAIVARHDILRTTFAFIDGQPMQKVSPCVEINLPLVDLSELSEKSEVAFAEAAAGGARKPFDLAAGPLVRFQLYRLENNRHVLLTTFHQTVIDGPSIQLFYAELAELYQAGLSGKEAQLPRLIVQYSDYSEWQRQVFQGGRIGKPMDYWRKKLAGAAPRLNLPTDHPASAGQNIAGAVLPVLLKKELVARLRAFSREQGVTLFMTLLTVFKSLLSQRSGQEDILVGSPVTGRNRLETEKLIGFFVDTVVLRTLVQSEKNFRQVLQEVRETALGAFGHAEAPFEKLVEELLPGRSRTQSPFFQVWFGLIDTLPAFPLGEARADAASISPGTAQFDLSLFVSEKETDILCLFEYKTALFERSTVEQFARDFEQLAAAVLDQPEAPLSVAFDKLRQQQEQETVARLEASRQALGQSLKSVRRKSIPIK